ncbi:hypothetical protein FKW77_006039 [Venturia effusa]|uniref:Uncharacterized protein n=1 Tax=Venturia effusa TaxID=50376 RepID=A0A517L7G4_9PEZI|nr:hypothetical protein FKW77_006039 [Venturia effusa]
MKFIFTHILFTSLGLKVLAAPQLVIPQATISCFGRTDHTTCPPRQLCFQEAINNPSSPTQPGICIGQPCGGFTPHPQYCPEGQACVRPVNDDASTANLPGHCVPMNLTCTATNGACEEGWSCVVGPKSECEMGDTGCQGLCEPDSWEPKSIAIRQASSTSTNKSAGATVTPSANPKSLHCGGFLNDPPLYGLCPRGQICAHPFWSDQSPKHESTCIGQPCGGLTVVGSPCPDQQVCITPTGHKSFSNPFTGTCLPEMWTCSDKQACGDGWTCVANTVDSNCRFGVDADCPGICQNSWVFWEAQTAGVTGKGGVSLTTRE